MRTDTFFASNFDRIEIEQWGCFSRRGASTDLQYDSSGRPCDSRDLHLMSDFHLNFLRSACISIDACRREEHDGALIISLTFASSKVIDEELFFF